MGNSVSGVVSPGLKSKKKLLLLALLLIAAVVILAWLTYNHYHKKYSPPFTGIELTQKTELSTETNTAASALKAKDYQQAINSYTAAYSTAFSNGDYTKSKSIIEECIARVPDKYVPWQVYQSLAITAQALKDTATEKSSFEKAIQKASQPGSGATQQNITMMQNALDKLK